MKKEEVEIYSDTSNRAVMRHPGRNYPGSLIQGDSLYALCSNLDKVLKRLKAKDYSEAQEELNKIRNNLWDRLNHYKSILAEHDITLPFNEK